MSKPLLWPLAIRNWLTAFTGNDPEVEAGLKAFYQDQSNWPPEMKERMKEFGG